MNSVNYTGVLQRIEVKTSTAGKTWVQGTIRVRNKMQTNGKYGNSFYDFKCLGQRADTFAKYHQDREGKDLAISGSSMVESWEGQDGQKRQRFMVMVDDFDLPPFDEKKTETAPQNQAPPASQVNKPPLEIDEDDLPF